MSTINFLRDANLLREAYAAWAEADLDEVLPYFGDDVVFAVNMWPELSFVGRGHTKDLLARRLQRLLNRYEVIEFAPWWIRPRGLWLRAHVGYCYRDRNTGWEIDGTMRHLWRIVDGKIVHFELRYDVPRMDAFRRFTAHEERRVSRA